MITTIINYCTNDFRFLTVCLQEVVKFSHEVIIPVCDHFFDGIPENRELLIHTYNHHRSCKFVEFAYEKDGYATYMPVQEGEEGWAHYWHSISRYIGYQFVSPTTQYVLFIDVDEVPDGERVLHWLRHFPLHQHHAYRCTAYFYFREARWRAKTCVRNPLLVQKSALSSHMLLDIYERKGSFWSIAGSKLEDVYGMDGNPLFHHYSWVKTKEEMLRKVSCWGHHLDRDWHSLIEKEFSAPFRGTDCLYGLHYDEVIPLCDPLLVTLPQGKTKGTFPHVTFVNPFIVKQGIVQKMLCC